MTLLIYLWIVPNKTLFTMLFSIANGPLLLSVPLFGNSLVLHSLDKTVSLLIHLTPSIITYVIKWEHNTHEFKFWDIDNLWSNSVCNNHSLFNGNNNCSHFLINFIVYPLLFTISHQLSYFILVQIICRKKVESDPNALTTYRYVFRNRSGTAYKVVSCLGPELRIYVFGFVKLKN